MTTQKVPKGYTINRLRLMFNVFEMQKLCYEEKII
jgi:hypothetical protein